jgi:hypothetical protein
MSCRCKPNPCKGTKDNKLQDILDILREWIRIEVGNQKGGGNSNQQGNTGLDSRLKALEDKLKSLEQLVQRAETAAATAEAAKQHAQQSVLTIQTVQAEMTEKLKDGFNQTGSFTVGGKTYEYKHGITVGVK